VKFNQVKSLNWRKRKFKFTCDTLTQAVGLWVDQELVITLNPEEAERLRAWLEIALSERAAAGERFLAEAKRAGISL
jgi:hypothetical protein